MHSEVERRDLLEYCSCRGTLGLISRESVSKVKEAERTEVKKAIHEDLDLILLDSVSESY